MRILVTGGGTGGHIYPALAMVRALQQLDNQVEVLYIGTENGLEKEIVTHEGIPFKLVDMFVDLLYMELQNLKFQRLYMNKIVYQG